MKFEATQSHFKVAVAMLMTMSLRCVFQDLFFSVSDPSLSSSEGPKKERDQEKQKTRKTKIALEAS